MNQIEIFNSPEFGSIRTLEQNGKVLFCGTDVATALGYTNPRKAVRDHTRGGTKCSIGVQTGKKADGSPAVQMVEMLFIPEGDLYRLIAHSKLPSAERFEQWVFDEVLPAIRKHGAYLTKEKLWEIATSPEALIKLCSELLAEREENASLREENALLESKAAFYDLFIDLITALLCGSFLLVYGFNFSGCVVVCRHEIFGTDVLRVTEVLTEFFEHTQIVAPH